MEKYKSYFSFNYWHWNITVNFWWGSISCNILCRIHWQFAIYRSGVFGKKFLKNFKNENLWEFRGSIRNIFWSPGFVEISVVHSEPKLFHVNEKLADDNSRGMYDLRRPFAFRSPHSCTTLSSRIVVPGWPLRARPEKKILGLNGCGDPNTVPANGPRHFAVEGWPVTYYR